MKFPVLVAAGMPLVMTAFAAEKSGHAEASLLCGVTSYQPGKPVAVGIKLAIDPGWHSYWINPGEGGMPLSAKWTLPPGWKAGELQHPVPKRFMTGELPGFGYEGEAIYRVDLTPPAGATGDAELKVELSWLTCSEDACVPGDVALSLKLPAGGEAAGKDAAVLAGADTKIPVSQPGFELHVAEADGNVTLRLKAPASVDPAAFTVYPATPQVLDAAARPVFVRSGDGWSATAKKNEYADGPVALLDIVLTGGQLECPLTVSWRKEK